MGRREGGGILRVALLSFCLVVSVRGTKYQYASATDCGRYSAQALYQEKFKDITRNIIEDSNEFVRRVSESMTDSLRAVMARIPDRDYSEKEESKVFSQFQSTQKAFVTRTKKAQDNITANWESALSSHFDLMMDRDGVSLKQYLPKIRNLADSYRAARAQLDQAMAIFIRLVKGIVMNGLQGIAIATQEALQKNSTSQESKDDQELSEEERRTAKKLEIAELVVEGFLGKVTLEVIKRKIDLFRRIDTKPENRDSVLDDTIFDISMIQNKILAIVQPDLPTDKGVIDLTRRTIYMYWLELASRMYKDKIESKVTSQSTADYKRYWSNEEQLADTLLSLMEIYP